MSNSVTNNKDPATCRKTSYGGDNGKRPDYFNFRIGKTGFSISVSFTNNGQFRVELYIDLGDYDENKRAFDQFIGLKDEIEREMGLTLSWERLDERRASRVAAYRKGTIQSPPEELEELQQWGLEMLGRFYKVFRGRVAEV